ncbi:MAG: NADH-quinone oxidoreductase subunit A [Pirellulaceae bacterium]
MLHAEATALGIVAYLALFFGVGLAFIFVNLLLGKFLRPADPHPEKLEIYECGEPTIGSSFVQFDLRFYVVALLFIIFDVEVAFFFPWAAVFGKASHMSDPQLPVATASASGQVELTPDARALYRELGVRDPQAPTQVPLTLAAEFDKTFGAGASAKPIESAEQATFVSKVGSKHLLWLTIVDIGVFFAVLMVGFAYVWRRGDLDWVRAISRDRPARGDHIPPETIVEEEPVLSA